ncbi:MAG: cytidylate kinase-like family protein [Dehalococcoidia bacterium]|nr:cytidylate kinase-like family protein [Dehalococcoidia bacterium]
MPVVTLSGRHGSPVRAVGVEAARLLGADYVDHTLIMEAAKRVGATVGAVAEKDERLARGGERIARAFQRFLERSAAAGSAGDPFMGPTGIEVLLSRSMSDAAAEPQSTADQFNDKKMTEVITSVIQDQAATGNVVIIGRGSNVILRNRPNVLHAWVISALETRIAEVARREQITPEAASQYIKKFEEGRLAYYKKFHKTDPGNPELYHLFLNVDRLGTERTARIIAEAAREQEQLAAKQRPSS